MCRRFVSMTLLLVACLTGARPAAPIAALSSDGLMTLEQALRSGAEAGGSLYAGDCSKTRSPEDIGKTCTKLVEQRGPVRAYLVGQTFSEFRRWLFLEDGPAGWVIVASAPMDTRASPIPIPWPAVPSSTPSG